MKMPPKEHEKLLQHNQLHMPKTAHCGREGYEHQCRFDDFRCSAVSRSIFCHQKVVLRFDLSTTFHSLQVSFRGSNQWVFWPAEHCSKLMDRFGVRGRLSERDFIRDTNEYNGCF